MSEPSAGHPHDVTALLAEWNGGDRDALNRLLPLVYAELRRVAARQLRGERVDQSLQATALVHEVYLRLLEQRRVDWHDRAHFFGVSAQIMRRILVDHARRRSAGKRGAGAARVSIDEAVNATAADSMPILELDRALERLEHIDTALARIVELRVFAGLTVDQIADLLNVSASTVKREWRTAQAWIARELGVQPSTH